MTRRIRLTVEYDGAAFHGWQRQPQGNIATVQDAIEKAIFKITGEQVNTAAAGRTDAGVHAKGQVCHFDIEKDCELVCFKDGINRFTPHEVVITNVQHVEDDFHARFSAHAREYEFLIFNRREPSALTRNHAIHIVQKLDVEKMHHIAQALVGEHNFSAFRTSECSAKSPVSHIEFINITREGDMVKLHIKATKFLHNMVRIITGTLCEIGRDHRPETLIAELLETKDRKKAGKTVPPQGLYFLKAYYPEYEIYDQC